MASISSLSSGSSIYGSRSSNIISGLASGMDTESMIEGMVQGIKSKIDKQKQQQTILGWQQEAYRSISDQLVSLSTKYTSYASSTNLMSSSFFTPSIITSLGKYADKISATGSTTSNIEILGVENLAKTETITFEGLKDGIGIEDKNAVSGSNGVDLTGEVNVSTIAGKSLVMEYGNESFTITFDSNKVYKDIDDVVEEINSQLKNKSVSTSDGDSINIGTKLEAKADGDKLVFEYKNKDDNNTVKISDSSSDSVLSALGLEEEQEMTSNGSPIKSNSDVTIKELYTNKKASEVLAGASITITYNGQQKTIKMPEKGSEAYDKIFGEGISKEDAAKNMEDYMQNQVDKAFGYGRITISNDGTDGQFQPKFQVKGEDTISIDTGTTNVIGKGGIFGIERGASNRVNTDKTLEDLLGDKLKDWVSIKKDDNGDDLYALEINGVKIGEYTKDTTLSTIMSDINNNSEAGVNVKYSETANQFVFTSTYGGAGGRIAIDDTTKDSTKGYTNVAANLFGQVTYNEDGELDTIRGKSVSNKNDLEQLKKDGVSFFEGQDGKMAVSVNGKEMVLTSGTNTFNIDGLSVTANEVFNTEKINDDGTINNDVKVEGVTFAKKADTDKIVDAIKSFVEDYNKMLEDLGTAYTTQPNNKYTALTDDQKADMTDKQIEEYEAKAKEGLLFGDRDLTALASELRFLFSGSDMSSIGITTSSDASDRGKLAIDENKLREAITGDIDAVKNAFTSPIQEDENGNVVSGGVMPKLKEVLDKYAATTGATKGILIEKAGSQYSPTALLNNTIKSEIEDIDDVIDKLTDQLNDKIDFYTSKFSKLEVLISQMNSQSSYLSSMSGGY